MISLDNLAERRRDVRPSRDCSFVEEREALQYVLAMEGWAMMPEERGRVAQRIRALGGDPAAVTILPPAAVADLSDLYEDEQGV
jgi:hypothetical protein